MAGTSTAASASPFRESAGAAFSSSTRRASLDAAYLERQTRDHGLHEAKSGAAMARERQWYEDVMDVALRATLKEHGFRRKSHATYICEHSPDRVWAFELALCHSPAQYFSESSGIFGTAIEAVMSRLAPECANHRTGMRTLVHATVGIGELIKIENGWDVKAWNQNPQSKTWLGGYRNHPSIDTVLRHIQPGGCFTHEAAGSPMKLGWPEWRRRVKTVTEELGHDLDMLWRKYELDWLQRCDDPLFHLAGADDRAAPYLQQRIDDGAIPYETHLEELELEKQAGFWERLWRGPPKPIDAKTIAQQRLKYWRIWGEAARKLADGLGIKL
jgi:hypothetical protein